MRQSRDRTLSVVAGVAGLLSAGLLVWAVLSSIGGFPRYSPLRHFISQLADPINPHASRVNQSFVLGGGLAALAMVVCSLRVRGRAATWAAGAAVGAAASLCLVGLFDITAPVPHFGFAILTGGLSLVACVLFARAMRYVVRDESSPVYVRRLAVAVRVSVVVQIASLLAGLLYAVVIVVRVGPNSLEQLLRLPPRLVWVEVGGTLINPFSIAEWVLFGVVTNLLVIASAHLLFRRYAG